METLALKKAALFAAAGCSLLYVHPAIPAGLSGVYTAVRNAAPAMLLQEVAALRLVLAPTAWIVFFVAVYADAVGAVSDRTKALAFQAAVGMMSIATGFWVWDCVSLVRLSAHHDGAVINFSIPWALAGQLTLGVLPGILWACFFWSFEAMRSGRGGRAAASIAWLLAGLTSVRLLLFNYNLVSRWLGDATARPSQSGFLASGSWDLLLAFLLRNPVWLSLLAFLVVSRNGRDARRDPPAARGLA